MEPNSRILGIYLTWEAMSSAGGTAGADFGDSDDPDRFITALDLDAAGGGSQRLRLDNGGTMEPTYGVGYFYEEETDILMTVTGETLAASKAVRGYILYSVS
jgi:hypothetical protein